MKATPNWSGFCLFNGRCIYISPNRSVTLIFTEAFFLLGFKQVIGFTWRNPIVLYF